MMLSSSVEVPSPVHGGMSGLSGMRVAVVGNVVRSSSISGAMYSLEKSPGSGGRPGEVGTLAGNKKRRSSLGAKMVAIVGLSQWSKSTLQLNQQEERAKKLRSTIRRSTETGIAVEMRNRVTRQGSKESTDGSTNSNSSDGTFIFPPTRMGPESQFSDFLDGLGPAQIVGRQTLATPSMGDVHVGMVDRGGQLEVEINQARGLTPKPGSKNIPGTIHNYRTLLFIPGTIQTYQTLLFIPGTIQTYPTLLFVPGTIQTYPTLLFILGTIQTYPTLLFIPGTIQTYPTLLFIPGTIQTYPTLLFVPGTIQTYPTLLFIPGTIQTYPTLLFVPGTIQTYPTLLFIPGTIQT
ncbi:regulating synaptic membrane exocytosis protein 3-like isoform X1 [Oncorhynchus mykiss]|uniref:regulating synaptic membrane exocytosis protein 3-like isoform X1 n=1 Tax=Oncorhynchus mykiss TaxID=8022 RepID=UPI001877B3DA|nr:regulating synaptic membrane exocytosis protein 3-like isoform X1 [Oncorhynchus mykiss]